MNSENKYEVNSSAIDEININKNNNNFHNNLIVD